MSAGMTPFITFINVKHQKKALPRAELSTLTHLGRRRKDTQGRTPAEIHPGRSIAQYIPGGIHQGTPPYYTTLGIPHLYISRLAPLVMTYTMLSFREGDSPGLWEAIIHRVEDNSVQNFSPSVGKQRQFCEELLSLYRKE